jgi:hypothetical protein
VNRVFKALRAENIVMIGRKVMTVVDKDRLLAEAAFEFSYLAPLAVKSERPGRRTGGQIGDA